MELKKVSIAYLSYDGLTDPLGQSQIIPYLIGLSKLGYQFTIISFEKPDRYVKLSSHIKEQLIQNKINWYPLRYTKKPQVLSTIWDVWRLWRAYKRLNLKKNFSVVHCRSYITSLIGLRAKENLGTKFIFDMRGFWADERVEGGLWNLRNPLYKSVYQYFKRKEKEFLANADHIISLTENAKKEISSWGIKIPDVAVIPTCVDTELFNPDKINKADQDKLRTQLGINRSDFVLLYLGSWGTWYLTEKMLNLFSEVKKQKPDSKFLLVTTDEPDLNNYLHRQDIIITMSSHDLVSLHISLAHLAVCFVKPSFSKKASSATKVGEILAMQIPLLCNAGWGDIEGLDGKGVFIVNELHLAKDISDYAGSNLPKIDKRLLLTNGIQQYHQAYRKVTSL